MGIQNWSMYRIVVASQESSGVVEPGLRDTPAEVKARRRSRCGLHQRAARGRLCERARRGPAAGSARLARLTLPVERVRVRGRRQCRRHRCVRLRCRSLNSRSSLRPLGSNISVTPFTIAITVPVPFPLICLGYRERSFWQNLGRRLCWLCVMMRRTISGL